MLLKGRRKIVSGFRSQDLQNIENVIKMLNAVGPVHAENRRDIDYLKNYRSGVQPILQKEKPIRPEINNMVVMNHAQMITRNIIGYFLGTPIQYIQNGDTTKKEQIDQLNRWVSYEDKASVDKEIGELQSICGTAYRIIYSDEAMFSDEVPFEDKALDPSNTFVVYENTIAEKPLAGVHYYTLLDEKGNATGTHLYVYTDFGVYEIIAKGMMGQFNSNNEYTFKEYNVGGIPIIEYPNNRWRTGDWELCIGLMDAINELHSGRLDDIDQVVQSLLVFINADLDGERYEEMRQYGVISLKNNTGQQSSVSTVQTTLDQAGMNSFAQELEGMLYALIGIPDRNNRSGGGGDTGQAVELRDGWADLEIIARNKELEFKKSEKQALRIILNMVKNKEGFDLSLLDVDIKFSRNKNNNLLVKSQAYSTLLATKTLTPADCLTIVDLVSDVNEFVARGEEFWGDNFANNTVGMEIGLSGDVSQKDTSKNDGSESVEESDDVE